MLKSKELEQGNEEEQQNAADGLPDAPEVPEPAAQPEEKQMRGSTKQVQTDLIQQLRDKQKSRHTLAVVRDILHDDRVRTYATMRLAHCESQGESCVRV